MQKATCLAMALLWGANLPQNDGIPTASKNEPHRRPVPHTSPQRAFVTDPLVRIIADNGALHDDTRYM